MYRTVFDLTKFHFDSRQGLIPGCFYFFLFGIMLLIIHRSIRARQRSNSFKALALGVVFVLFSSIMIFALVIPQLLSPSRAKQIIKEGKFMVVEGTPENFHPMPPEGHSEESFELQGVNFHYSDFEARLGYHHAESLGGVIHPGNYYRITYYPDQDSVEEGGHSILKIELRVDEK